MTSRDTDKLINRGLNLASKLIESDTDVSMFDLNLLENLNTNQSLNYIKLEQNLNTLEKNATRYQQLGLEFKSHQDQLAHMDQQVEKVAILTKELDLWSKQLEIKVKKLYP